MGDFFATAGEALQPGAAGFVAIQGSGGDIEAGVAAKSTKENAGGFLDVGESDGSFGVMAACGLGDPVMPEFADDFFHDFPC